MATTTIKLKVEDENIVFTSQPPVFSGDVNTISVEFEFGVNWDGLTKYAVFYRDIEEPYQVALESNNTCLVPHEVMETAGRMFIGVYGQADGKIKTSEVVFYDLGTGVLAGGQPSSEKLNMWQQILQDMDTIRETAETLNANIQTAQNAATTATQAASTATTKASEASNSASQASTSALQAQTYASDAEDAKTGAETARDQAGIKVQEAIDEMSAEISASINDALSPRIVESATGEAVTVDDASGARLAGLKLYGKSVQNITKGKNLCSVADIEISGSQTVSLDEIPAGTYTISAVVTSTDTDANECLMMFYYTDSSTKEINIGRSTGTERKSVSVTFDKAVNKVRVYASTSHTTSSGDTASVTQLQIESGSTATAYEVYTDGQPSPTNPVPIESVESPTVTFTGKNLIESYEGMRHLNGATYTVDGSTIKVTGQRAYAMVSNRIDAKPLRGKYLALAGNREAYNQLDWQTTNSTGGVGYPAVYKPLLVDDDIKFIDVRMMVNNHNVGLEQPKTVTFSDVGLYLTDATGTADKSFVPPTEWQELATALNLYAVPVESGGNYTDEDGQQWIADVADFETGKITRNVMVFDVDPDNLFNFNVSNEAYNQVQYDLVKVDDGIYIKRIYPSLSNKLKKSANDYVNIVTCETTSNDGWKGYVRAILRFDKQYDTLDAIKTAVGNDMVLICAIPSDTTEDIPQDVMQAYKNLHTNEGTTNVFTDSDPQAGIELEYVADTKSYIDKRIDAIASTLINNVTGD